MLYTDEFHATKIMYFPVSSAVLVKFDETHKNTWLLVSRPRNFIPP
jgi:hypothetical protein